MSTSGKVEFDVGVYNGELKDSVPNGHGRLEYKQDDTMGRKFYEGQFQMGKNTGQGLYYTTICFYDHSHEICKTSLLILF